MRILHLVDRLTDRGGAYRYLLGVLEALVSTGHDVHLAAGRDDGAAAACPLTLVHGLESRTRQPVDLAPLIRATRPDLLHVHTVVNPAVLEELSARPAVITVQDHRCFCPGQGKWTRDGRVCDGVMEVHRCASCFDDPSYSAEIFTLTLARLIAVRRFPGVIVLSDYIRRELISVGVHPSRITVIPPFVHGLDPDASVDGPRCILFVGRLTRSKGVLDAVDAWKLAALDLPLLVAGTGPLREEVEAAGAHVLGWLDRARLSSLYRRAAAVVMPSRWQEPFGMVGLEAQFFGVPVVTWRCGGVEEWHPAGPALVRWSDVAGLARALRTAVSSTPGLRPRPGNDRASSMASLMATYQQSIAFHSGRV